MDDALDALLSMIDLEKPDDLRMSAQHSRNAP
jgi:hypothetical protein